MQRKYNVKRKSSGIGGKPNNSNATGSAIPSTLQKGSSGSKPLCFRCKKNYSLGHEENARLSRLNVSSMGKLDTMRNRNAVRSQATKFYWT